MKMRERPLVIATICVAVLACASACSGSRPPAASAASSPAPVNEVANCSAAVHGSVLKLFMVYDQTVPGWNILNESSGYRNWFADLQKMPAKMNSIAVSIGTAHTQTVASGTATALQEAQDLQPQVEGACKQAYETWGPAPR